jgi:hypothetical protein
MRAGHVANRGGLYALTDRNAAVWQGKAVGVGRAMGRLGGAVMGWLLLSPAVQCFRCLIGRGATHPAWFRRALGVATVSAPDLHQRMRPE